MQIPNTKLEEKAFAKGFDFVSGCDEVGRGPIAGPVVACACAFDYNFFNSPNNGGQNVEWHKRVRDSKTLSEKKREELALLIQKNCLAYAIGEVAEGQVDLINIHNATLRAMEKAVRAMLLKIALKRAAASGKKNIIVFFDGKFIPENLSKQENFQIYSKAVVGGDAKVFSVSAASIVAKVYRDNLMKKHHQKMPEYGFAKHKGYGTKEHFKAIIKHGLSPIHRRSFIKI